MPSFSTISVFATLALAAFTSAVPTASPVVDLEARQSNILGGLLSTVQSAAQTITKTSDFDTTYTGLNIMSTALTNTTTLIKANPAGALAGLGTNDVINILTAVINILGPCLTLVSGMISGGTLGGSDISALTGLVTLVLNLLGTLITLLLTLVPCLPLISSLVSLIGSAGLLSSLLATVITLVITLITPVITLIIGGLLPVVTSSGLGSLIGIFGVGGSYPSGLGGTLSIVTMVTSILTSLLGLLLGLVSI